MSTKSWTIHVDGVAYEVAAITDPENGRTAIRVDGRMAARPMGAEDEERELKIGSAAYIMRRLPKGELDLDLAPPDFSAGAPAWTPPRRSALSTPKPQASRSGGSSKSRIAGAIIGVLLLGAVGRYAKDAIAYLRVPWQTYTAPDNAFRVSFAGKPDQKSETINAGGQSLSAVQLRSRFKNHAYLLEWVEFPFVIPNEKEADLLNGVLDDFVKGEKASVLKREWGHASGHDALVFLAQLPGSKEWARGTMRGQLIVDGQRVYIAYAYVPQGESLSFDVGEYLRSLELPH